MSVWFGVKYCPGRNADLHLYSRKQNSLNLVKEHIKILKITNNFRSVFLHILMFPLKLHSHHFVCV